MPELERRLAEFLGAGTTTIAFGTTTFTNYTGPAATWHAPVLGMVYVWKGKQSSCTVRVPGNHTASGNLCFQAEILGKHAYKLPNGGVVDPTELPMDLCRSLI